MADTGACLYLILLNYPIVEKNLRHFYYQISNGCFIPRVVSIMPTLELCSCKSYVLGNLKYKLSRWPIKTYQLLLGRFVFQQRQLSPLSHFWILLPISQFCLSRLHCRFLKMIGYEATLPSQPTGLSSPVFSASTGTSFPRSQASSIWNFLPAKKSLYLSLHGGLFCRAAATQLRWRFLLELYIHITSKH